MFRLKKMQMHENCHAWYVSNDMEQTLAGIVVLVIDLPFKSNEGVC
ncbi:Protein of unknown function [Pyronema omphalodes CBS 100304]|uniref:Uncharacterized protein n=1 Tax=Pyronema omphalodes (strain CBS 100304) TaxID=1076935 RepID=U4LRZ7_PYROM|nr:Protein of unknown function [Pyronema omphalodes CBS 100304]